MATTTGPDPAVMEAIERGNAVVFLDVAMGEDNESAAPLGRIKLELFVKDVSFFLYESFPRCTSFHSLVLLILSSAPKRAKTFVSSVPANSYKTTKQLATRAARSIGS